MSLSVHIDNKGKDILIIGEKPTQGLDDTTLTAEARYHIIFIGLLTGIVSPSTHTKWVSLSNKKWFNLFLLNYILMNAVKNFTTIHFPLN